jgi:L-rhamnose mutarotase
VEKKQRSAWLTYIQEAQKDHIREYMEKFPQDQVHPELLRLVKIAEVNPRIRHIDRAQLSRRLEIFRDQVAGKLESMTDMEVGRTWAYTALDLAQSYDVQHYVWVAEMADVANPPCWVCVRLHGLAFSVSDAKKKIKQNDFKFPRFEDLKGKTTRHIESLGLSPPAHPNCRCEIVLAWNKK